MSCLRSLFAGSEGNCGRKLAILYSICIPLSVVIAGCEEEPPSSEYGRIVLGTRPETVDHSLVDEFSIRFGEVDPLAKNVTVTNGEELQITGTLKPKDGVLDQMEFLNLKTDRRPIVEGRADWTVDESLESTERLIKYEWGLGIEQSIDRTVEVDTEPGKYELRFYAIRDRRNSQHGYRPEIYLLGEGRMTVLPGEKKTSDNSSCQDKE